ncbi:MAG: hypothetical protein ACI97A_000171 [Planctomycetota bacterium]|jgi:hypothetical protein
MGSWLERQKNDPIPWLMEKACPPIKFRIQTEIMGLPGDDVDVAATRNETYNYKPPYSISTSQSDDGTWFTSLAGFDHLNLNRKRGPGTLFQYRSLVEYGWGTDHPIVWRTSELLQGLMWQDPSVDLCELKGYCGGDPAVEAYIRRMLAQRALALLARSNFADDIGVKRKTAEVLDALDAFYQGDVHSKIYTGELIREIETDDGPQDETCAVISPDAFRPEYWIFMLFGRNPALKDDPRAKDVLRRIVDYMFSNPIPEVEVLEVGGKVFDRFAEFSIRNLEQEDFEEKKLVGRLLQELEFLARTGVLEDIPKAKAMLEWLMSLQDDEGVVRAEEFIEKAGHRLDYSYFPLEDNWRGKHKKFTDVTFRLLLILSILDGKS